MHKLTITIFYVSVLGLGFSLSGIHPACSRVSQSEPAQKTSPKKDVIRSTSEQDPTDLEPVSDKVIEPKAKITAPAGVVVKSYVILDFTGTVSSVEPDFDVVFRPEGSASAVTKLYSKNRSLAYGLLVPDKAGKYRIAIVAFATDGNKTNTVRSYGFVDVDVADPGKPPEPSPQPPGSLPDPPLPGPAPLPAPTPSKPTEKKDLYGMYSYTKDLLSKMPPNDPWQSRIPLIYDSFDKMIAQSSSFTDPTSFVLATSDLYKSALGKDYKYFSHYFFTPLKTELGRINSSGKLPSTVEAQAQAWREVSQALHEVKPVTSSSMRSHH